MPDDSKPIHLIAFLTAPLKKVEHHERAQEVLAEAVEDREAVVPRHFYKGLAMLWLLAALAVGLVWNHYRKPAFRVSSVDMIFFTMPMLEALPIGGETPEELRFLGLGEGTVLQQKEKLHQSAPDNSLYYRHYVDAYLHEREALPPEYFETVKRIDPDNAYWWYVAASRLANEACEHLDYVGERGERREVDGVRIYPPSRPRTYEILDAALLEEAVGLLEKGAQQPESRTYLREHIARVGEIHDRLNPDPALLETITETIQFYSNASGALRIKRADHILGGALYQAARNKDEAQYRRLAAIRESFLRQHSENYGEMLVGALVYKAVAHTTALSLMHASEVLGLKDEAARYRKEAEQFDAMRNDRRNRSREDDPEWKRLPKMAVLHQQAMPVLANQVASAPSMEGYDFKPLRLVEHEFVSQWLTMTLGVILLLLTLPVFFARFLFPRPIRVGAIRAARLLQPVDWLKIFGLGVLLPVVLHLLLTRFTFLGGRGYGIGGLGYAYPMLPLITLLVSMWMASSIVIRRCLSERLPLPPASKRQIRTPWIYLGFALGIYVFGYVWMRSDIGPYSTYADPERFYTLLWMHAGLLLALAIWSLWIRVRGTHAERFRMLATFSALIPCIPVAVVCLAVLLPIHLAGEKRWMAADDTLMPDPTQPDFGLYEGKVTVEAFREVNAILYPEKE